MHTAHTLSQTRYGPLGEAPGKLDSSSVALLIDDSARWATRSLWLDPVPPSGRDAMFSVGLSPSPNSDAGDTYG